MESAALLMGIIPLLVFVIVDSFAGMRSALVSAIFFAFVEVGFSLYYFQELDLVSLFSVALVIIMALISYKKQSDIFFKFQPVIIGVLLSLFLIGSYYIDRPLLFEMMYKYQDKFPPQIASQLSHPAMPGFFKLATLYIGVSFMVHAIFTAWIALKFNKWWWIAMRGIGFYVFMFVGMVLAQIQNLSNFNN